jgi:hypothetical protein
MGSVLDNVANGHVLLQELRFSHTISTSWLFPMLLLKEKQTETAWGPCNKGDESIKEKY